MKTCTKCGEAKPLSEYHTDAAKSGGLRHECKVCVRQRRASYVANNKEKVAEADAAYKKRNRAKYNEINRRQYERYRDAVLARQREYYQRVKERKAKYARQYFEANRADYTRRVAKRRAVARQAEPLWANAALIKLLYATRQYLTEQTGELWHIDHVVPLQGRNVCGLHVHFNLRVVPAKVNLAKGNKFPIT
jgi:hypothetical protein